MTKPSKKVVSQSGTDNDTAADASAPTVATNNNKETGSEIPTDADSADEPKEDDLPLEEGVTQTPIIPKDDIDPLEPSSDEPLEEGVSQSPIVVPSIKGELNDVFPFELDHSRDRAFYGGLTDESFELLLEIVKETLVLHDIAVDIHEDGEADDPDPLKGLALNIGDAIFMGLSNLSSTPMKIIEEVKVANTALGVASFIYEVQKSIAFPTLSSLSNKLKDFEEMNPSGMSINLITSK